MKPHLIKSISLSVLLFATVATFPRVYEAYSQSNSQTGQENNNNSHNISIRAETNLTALLTDLESTLRDVAVRMERLSSKLGAQEVTTHKIQMDLERVEEDYKRMIDNIFRLKVVVADLSGLVEVQKRHIIMSINEVISDWEHKKSSVVPEEYYFVRYVCGKHGDLFADACTTFNTRYAAPILKYLNKPSRLF